MTGAVNGGRKLKLCVLGVSSSIHIQRRSTCFAQRGHEVTVVSPVPYRIPGVGNVCIPVAWGDDKARIPLSLYRLVRVIRKLRPDIVHVHYAGVFELLAAYLAGRPYVVTMMGSDILQKLDRKMAGIKKQVMIFCLKRASLLNALSDKIADVTKKHIGEGRRIIKITWGIDFDLFRPVDKLEARRRFDVDGDKFVILSPRLMKPLYNIDVIVRAVALLPEDMNCQVLLCSYNADAVYREYVENLIQELEVGHKVKILDSIGNEVMPYLYCAADISVMIPTSDGMPKSLLEAMACGVPNIVTNSPDYDEIVADKVSALYANINENDLSAAIVRLYSDEYFRDNIVTAAFKIIEKQASFHKDVTAIENEYLKIVNINI